MDIWPTIREEAEALCAAEPELAGWVRASALDAADLGAALANIIGGKLQSPSMPDMTAILASVFKQTEIVDCARADLQAVRQRDSACRSYLTPLLFFKGFQALQLHRGAHHIWNEGRHPLALLLQSRGSEVFDIDIHPAARIGRGLMIDHGSGVVIGETAVVGDEVSIMQGVTLGGTGKEHGDRHPKIGRGVLLSTCAQILGNIQIGDGAKVAANSVVLKDVPPHTTVAGVPAAVVGQPKSEMPALDMKHELE